MMKSISILLGLFFAAIAGAAEKMNVLLIISDDMRTELGCYASSLAKTPNLDKLAQSGVKFERAYCQFPLCNPSRASMLTGLKPGTIGVLGNRDWFGEKLPKIVSLPKYFKDKGYTTVGAGKIFHGGIDDTDAWSIGGKERFLAGMPKNATGRSVKKNVPKDGTPALTKDQRSDRRIVLKGNGEQHADYRTADRVIEQLRALKDQPFFIGCGFLKPHTPLEAPQRFYDLWDAEKIPLPIDFAPRPTVPEGFPKGSIRARNADLFINRDASPEEARETIRAYLASASFMDWNVGRVMDELERLDLRKNTIVVFWGDHGFQLGEKGKWSKAGSLWEQGARTPFIICDPREDTAGKACPRIVEMIDLFPTLTELCGLETPTALEGKSLAGLLKNPEAPWDRPAYTVWSEDGKHYTGVSVRTERWHFAEFFGKGQGKMLLDPRTDPHEIRNLAADPQHAETVASLSKLARTYAEGRIPPDK
jgi:iduronate 2-sulfatase